MSLHRCTLAIDTLTSPWDVWVWGVCGTPQLLPAWSFLNTTDTENNKISIICWSWFEAQLTWPSGNLSISASSSSLFLGPGFFLACDQCGFESSWNFCCCSSSFSSSSSRFMTWSSWVNLSLNSDGVSSTGSWAGFTEAFFLNWCILYKVFNLESRIKEYLLRGPLTSCSQMSLEVLWVLMSCILFGSW